MKKKNSVKILSVLLAVLLLGGMVPLAAAAEEAQTVTVSVKGTYIPPKMEAVLERINAIREKAMGESYTPLEWSADLETAARLRAAEASVSFSHTRPNGQSWDTVFAEADAQNGKAENLAWNAGDETADAMQQAVELWYAEKAAYEKDKNDPSAGHYAALIDPAYKTIGIAAFQGEGSELAATAAELSTAEAPEGEAALQNAEDGTVTEQQIEVAAESLSLSITADGAKLKEQEKLALGLSASVTFGEGDAARKTACTVISQVQWSSSDETVATVDETGVVTAVAQGKAEITATVGGCSASVALTVEALEPEPTEEPSEEPKPSEKPSEEPKPSEKPSEEPKPSEKPSEEPKPSEKPSEEPKPSEKPSEEPEPTEEPSEEPKPSEEPSEEPKPSEEPSEEPEPTEEPSEEPKPTEEPSEEPEPTEKPTPTSTAKPTATPKPTETPKPTPVPTPSPTPVKTDPAYTLRIDREGFTITDDLKAAGLDSEEKIRAAFEAAWEGETIKGVQYLDVKLQVSTDGNATWQVVGEEAYADGGKFIGLPRPEGAGAQDALVVYHMYAEDMLGHKAGDIEVFEGDDIRVENDLVLLTVSGFSPFAVVWKEAPPETTSAGKTRSGDAQPTATPVPTAEATAAPSAAPTNGPDLKVPPTGDATPFAARGAVASASAAGLAALRPRRRRKR